MSVLTYNNVTLPYSQVTSFRTEAVYEESDTDRILTRYDIQVQFLVSADGADLMNPLLDSARLTDPAHLIFSVKKLLMQQRKALSFKFNGVEFIPQPATGNRGTVDSWNGPKPQGFNFVKLTNTAWWCTYHVVAHYRVNPEVNPLVDAPVNENLPGNVLLYNRWEDSVTLDQCQYTTRTRTGKYMIRSDNTEGWIADQVRDQMAVTGVTPGCVRTRSQYTVDKDGLSVSYSLEDREVRRLPPAPAMEADGVYTEISSRADGKRYGRCWVKLRGRKDTDQLELLTTAMAVVGSKLFNRGQQLGDFIKSGVMEGASVQIGMYDNWVRAEMNVMYARADKKWDGLNFISPKVVEVKGSLGYVPAPHVSDRGTAGVLLQAARYYDPDLRDSAELDADDQRLAEVFVDDGGGHTQLPRGLKPGEAGRKAED